jgi:SOS-response transcriptional repressor LexA
MARAGIYKSEVLRARDKLLATGRNPSIDAVREELGSGSKTTIHRYLKEIEEEEGGATGSRVAVSEAIQDLVGRLAARVNEEAEERVTAAQARHAEQLTQHQQAVPGPENRGAGHAPAAGANPAGPGRRKNRSRQNQRSAEPQDPGVHPARRSR